MRSTSRPSPTASGSLDGKAEAVSAPALAPAAVELQYGHWGLDKSDQSEIQQMQSYFDGIAEGARRWNANGGQIPGLCTDQELDALWSDPFRYLAARRVHGKSKLSKLWALPQVWVRAAQASTGHPVLSSLLRPFLFDNPQWLIKDEELAEILKAPKGARGSKILIGVQYSTLGADWAEAVVPVLSLARWAFNASERRALLQAFEDDRFDAAASMAADLSTQDDQDQSNLPPHAIQTGAREKESDQERLDAMAGAWIGHILHGRLQKSTAPPTTRNREHTPTELQHWGLFMVRQWVRQEPLRAQKAIDQALQEAVESWDWAQAAKGSVPGPLTASERAFGVMVERARSIALAAGVPVPGQVIQACETLSLRNLSEQAPLISKSLVSEQPHAKESPSGSLVVAAPLDTWSKAKLRARQGVLLRALSELDLDAIAWCVGAGGLQGERLRFSRGNMGPLDQLCVRPNWEKESLAVQALALLEQAGLDLLLEGRLVGKNPQSNPFIRGALLASNGSTQVKLTHALVEAQGQACLDHGVALPDLVDWLAQARDSSMLKAVINSLELSLNAKHTPRSMRTYLDQIGAFVERQQLAHAIQNKPSPPTPFTSESSRPDKPVPSDREPPTKKREHAFSKKSPRL